MSPRAPLNHADRDALLRDVFAGGAGQHQAERRLGALLPRDRELLDLLREALRDDDVERAATAARVIGHAGPRAAELVPDLLAAIERSVVGEDAIDALRRVAKNDGDVARRLADAWFRLPPADPDDLRRMRIFEAVADFRRHASIFEPVLHDALVRADWWEPPYADGTEEVPVHSQEQEVHLIASHVGVALPGAERSEAPDGWRLRRPRDRWPRSTRRLAQPPGAGRSPHPR